MTGPNPGGVSKDLENATYGAGFFESLADGSRRSAKVIVPLILQLVQPKSVVDVGSGDGAWLREFSEHGIADYLGIDGDYVTPDILKIPPDRFRSMNLAEPTSLARQFDLAVSLEVAEHLPGKVAQRFVQYLTSLAPVILFSAAIPGQGGTHHINEQWPWFWESLFEALGYVRIDAIRPGILDRNDVEWWYRQNVFVFVRENALPNYPRLNSISRSVRSSREATLAIVNEQVLRSQVGTWSCIKRLALHIPRSIWRSLKRQTRG